MGHHMDDQGRFQSDKHPLPPDRIRLSFLAPRSRRALRVLAEDYAEFDPGLSNDINARLNALDAEGAAPARTLKGTAGDAVKAERDRIVSIIRRYHVTEWYRYHHPDWLEQRGSIVNEEASAAKLIEFIEEG